MKHFEGLALVVTLVICGGATAAATPFTDPLGDSKGPDVVAVDVSHTNRTLTVLARFANRSSLVEGDVVLMELDTDANGSTGEDGVDLYAAFLAGEDPIAFRWEDGAYVEQMDYRVSFAAGAAKLVVPRDILGKTVGISVTAVAGQDPGVDPTDRAPDTGRWMYTVATPTLVKASVRFFPPQPRAGHAFTLRSALLTLSGVGTVAAKRVRCNGTLHSKSLRQIGNCSWKVPADAKGKVITIAVRAEYAGIDYRLPLQRAIVR